MARDDDAFGVGLAGIGLGIIAATALSRRGQADTGDGNGGQNGDNGSQNGDDTQNGDGSGQEPTCATQVTAAQEFASGQSCSGGGTQMVCPLGNGITYTAGDECERIYLQSVGWTVVEHDQDPDDAEDPEPVQYDVQIYSDSPTGVDYRLHVGANPTPLEPPEVEPKWQAEAGGNDTIQQLPDGTWLIEGRVGSSDGSVYADSYRWTSTEHTSYGILGWESNINPNRIEVNGQMIAIGDLPVITV